MKQKPKHPEMSALTALGLVGQVGLVVAIAIVGGLVGGLMIDRWLGGTGIFLVLGIFLGIGAGAYAAYRLLITETDKAE